jgi:hypothetical protein
MARIVASPGACGLRLESPMPRAFSLADHSWSVSVRLPEFGLRPHMSLSQRSANRFRQRAASTTLLYTTGGAIATRNDATGALAPAPASPLAVLDFPAVIDAQGR